VGERRKRSKVSKKKIFPSLIPLVFLRKGEERGENSGRTPWAITRKKKKKRLEKVDGQLLKSCKRKKKKKNLATLAPPKKKAAPPAAREAEKKDAFTEL